MNWLRLIDPGALAVCLVLTLALLVIGAMLGMSANEMVNGTAMVFAGYYFGRWCARNFG